MSKKNRNKNWKKIRVTAILFLAATGLVFILLQSLAVFTIEEKIISVTNFFNQDVILKINEEEFQLRPFDVMTMESMLTGNIQITATNTKGEVVYEREFHNSGLSKKILAITLAPNTKSYCYVKADVTDLYYIDSLAPEEVQDISDIEVMENEFANTVYFGLLKNDHHYVYPGRTGTIELPLQLNRNVKVIGVYPIECTHIEDLDYIENQINTFVNYSASEQRNFFESEKKRIENTQRVDEL